MVQAVTFLRALLRPWCWIVGHRGHHVTAKSVERDGFVYVVSGCSRCRAPIYFDGIVKAGSVMTFRDGKWRPA